MYLISEDKDKSFLNKDNNNLEIVRLIAAIMVIYGHSFTFYPTDGAVDPVFSFTGVSYLGSSAVAIFFFISGILVTQSYIKRGSSFEFVVMRATRIWPAYIICILLTVLVIGPLYTIMSIPDYFSNKDLYRYILGNLSMLEMTYGMPSPSYLHDVYWPHAINVSIWTLPLEVGCYLLVLLLGLMNVWKSKLASSISIFIILLFAFSYSGEMKLFKDENVIYFMFGALASVFANKLKISVVFSVILILFYLFTKDSAYGKVIYFVTLFYSILVLSSLNIIRKIRFKGDYSYGTYLYGCVVQQIVAFHFPSLDAYQSLVLTIPISVLLGYISWILVEENALKVGRRYCSAANFNFSYLGRR